MKKSENLKDLGNSIILENLVSLENLRIQKIYEIWKF